MIAPLILLLTSLAGLAVALWAGATDLALLAVPCVLASLFLLLRAWLGRKRAPGGQVRPIPPRRRKSRRQQWVIVDGSNVLHWKDNVAAIATVREVVAHLTARGFTPGVVFDANAGYKIADRYMHHYAMARQLGLPEDRVMVVPKGTPADPIVLAAARDHRARVVSNDRFRDWADAHPEVTKPGHLIRGGYRDGVLWLDLDMADMS